MFDPDTFERASLVGPRAHWLMAGEAAGRVLVVPLAPPASGVPTKCRPIGCYEAATHLATRYREDP